MSDTYVFSKELLNEQSLNVFTKNKFLVKRSAYGIQRNGLFNSAKRLLFTDGMRSHV